MTTSGSPKRSSTSSNSLATAAGVRRIGGERERTRLRCLTPELPDIAGDETYLESFVRQSASQRGTDAGAGSDDQGGSIRCAVHGDCVTMFCDMSERGGPSIRRCPAPRGATVAWRGRRSAMDCSRTGSEWHRATSRAHVEVLGVSRIEKTYLALDIESGQQRPRHARSRCRRRA